MSANYEYENTPFGQSIKHLIPGDLIKLMDEEHFELNNIFLNRDYIGEPLHSYKPIFEKPILYWEQEEKFCTFLFLIPKDHIKIDISLNPAYHKSLILLYFMSFYF